MRALTVSVQMHLHGGLACGFFDAGFETGIDLLQSNNSTHPHSQPHAVNTIVCGKDALCHI